MPAFLQRIFGSRNERILNKFSKTIQKINALESSLITLSAEELKQKVADLKQRVIQNKLSLDQALPEAFALVREASKRALGMRHFDVQLLGGMVLHHGKIAEMRTGEGKTLVATLPAFLNALSGKGVHIITVNDYLAKRDASQMRVLFETLGLTTGVILSDLSPQERKAAYACDITYGTNNEFGFDYLRDHMALDLDQQVQRKLNYAVIDEVDSILIDEARTPLIISGPTQDSSELYLKFTQLIKKLEPRSPEVDPQDEQAPGDFYLDEKSKQAFLTEAGHRKMEDLLVQENLLKPGESLYAPEHVSKMHYISAVLRAQFLFIKDVHYMVKNQEILIVDEHTGRAMPGRRWSDGLHQAIEAKEGVKIQNENQTFASITFQNFFKQYEKISGMTGTADTEAYEFHQIYNLEVVVIPTHRPMVRVDHPDLVYLTEAEKFEAIIQEIKSAHLKQQPVLVGTTSIENSERLSELLTQENIPHAVLNAKQHEKEAHIITQAGKPGAVTIATNMAGRGTDIILGGNYLAEIEILKQHSLPTSAELETIKQAWITDHQTVIQAGGLYILGTERHESRRIDNQLRGRSGRQGDPGVSRFYLSLEDNLMRIFAGPWVKNIMSRIGMGHGHAIESPMVSKQIAKAQKKVENHHFDIRKSLLEFDNVANDQRQVIYAERQALLESTNISPTIEAMRQEVAELLIHQHMPAGTLEEQWDVLGLEKALQGDFNLALPIQDWLKQDPTLTEEAILPKVITHLHEAYLNKKSTLNPELIQSLERTVVLQTLDRFWREHLQQMDHLRHSVNLRSYAQKDPRQEYKRESFQLFSKMLERFRYEVVSILSKLEVNMGPDINTNTTSPPSTSSLPPLGHTGTLQIQHADLTHLGTEQNQNQNQNLKNLNTDPRLPLPNSASNEKISRNAACPCGSGKKYKHCHGALS